MKKEEGEQQQRTLKNIFLFMMKINGKLYVKLSCLIHHSDDECVFSFRFVYSVPATWMNENENLESLSLSLIESNESTCFPCHRRSGSRSSSARVAYASL